MRCLGLRCDDLRCRCGFRSLLAISDGAVYIVIFDVVGLCAMSYYAKSQPSTWRVTGGLCIALKALPATTGPLQEAPRLAGQSVRQGRLQGRARPPAGAQHMRHGERERKSGHCDQSHCPDRHTHHEDARDNDEHDRDHHDEHEHRHG